MAAVDDIEVELHHFLFNFTVAKVSRGYEVTALCVVVFLRYFFVKLTYSFDETDTTRA